MNIRITRTTYKRLGGPSNPDLARKGERYFASPGDVPKDTRTTAWMLGIHEMFARFVHYATDDPGAGEQSWATLIRVLGHRMRFLPADGDRPSIEYIERASDLTPTVMFVGQYRGWPVVERIPGGGHWKIGTIRSVT